MQTNYLYAYITAAFGRRSAPVRRGPADLLGTVRPRCTGCTSRPSRASSDSAGSYSLVAAGRSHHGGRTGAGILNIELARASWPCCVGLESPSCSCSDSPVFRAADRRDSAWRRPSRPRQSPPEPRAWPSCSRSRRCSASIHGHLLRRGQDAAPDRSAATYLSVGVIAVFFSFMAVDPGQFLRPSHVVMDGWRVPESRDATSFVRRRWSKCSGPWAGIATGSCW